ncbi:MAG: hypothetical protein KU28_03295 [Sulfurovum sp. PC08-66]|nr:MAG: hypothetical protein KU28_03295 [Sulfurovum sp. PC08-66]
MSLLKTKEHLAIISFLNSFETISSKLEKYFHFFNTKKDYILENMKDENSYRYDLDLDDSYRFLKHELNLDTLKVFDYLAKRHYKIYNGKIYICNDTFEEYQLLGSSIDLNPLMAHYTLKHTDGLEKNNRLRFIDNNRDVDFKFYGDLEKRLVTYSDLHIHLGGALPFEVRLHHLLKDANTLDLKQQNQKLFKHIGCHFTVADIVFATSIIENMLISLYINNEQEVIDNVKNDLNYFLKLLKNQHSIREYISFRKYNITGIRHIHKVEFNNHNGDTFEDMFANKMIQEFQNNNIKQGDRYLMLFFLNKLQHKDSYALVIEIYLVLRNIIKQFMVQQHKREGLGYFSLYSSSKIRRDKKEYEKKIIIDHLLHVQLNSNIEGRISASSSSTDTIKAIKGYIDNFEADKNNESQLKFVFHFQKSEDKTVATIKKLYSHFKNSQSLLYSRPRWSNHRKEIKQQALAIKDILSNPTYRKYPLYPKLTNKKGKITQKSIHKLKNIQYFDYVNYYIGGIDVAGKEFLTKPEVYAPIYRNFKKSIETSGKVLQRDYPYIETEQLKEIDFKYTYHVGEDFRDILSGLRAIFEAILFLDLKDGDRIGHGLALGIDPKLFLSNRNHEIKLSKQEALDNALFVYYIINRYNVEFTIAKSSVEEIIYGLSKDIYRNTINTYFNIDDLMDAWFLRRNCPNEVILCKDLFDNRVYQNDIKNRTYQLKMILQQKHLHHFIPNIDFVKNALPDFIANNDNNGSIHSRYNHLHNNPIAYRLYWLYMQDAEVIFRGEANYEHNFLFHEDFYEQVQDVIMEYIVAPKGIIIESMLSSNILIGGISKYSQHPIFRFKPIEKTIMPNRFNIRTKKMSVVLGTDNPGIQNTTYIKELYHLKEACIQNGATPQEAYQYILEIVNEGNHAFAHSSA